MSNQNDNFDFEEFSVRAIRNIDSVRSHGKKGVLPIESRINAFYRAIGLPAVVPEDERELPNGSPDIHNNGNVNDLNFNTYGVRLDERQSLHDKKIEAQEVEDFLDINKQNIKASILINSADRRKRGVLFPMVVDGRIHVFPQIKRIGGAFMSKKELKHGKTRYKSPLIETILSIKLKGENVIDSTKQDSVNTSFKSGELKDMHKNTEARLNRTLNKVVFVLENTIRLISRTRRNVGFNVLPTVTNVPEQNPKIQESETRTGELEIMKNEQEIQTGVLNAVLSLFEFDDTIGFETKNLRGEGFTDLFLDLLVPREQANRHSKRIDRKIEKATHDIKKAFRSLDLLLGTFGAISGVDILIVISDLYRLDSEHLVGLLNKESQERLKVIKGNIPAIAGAKGLTESITKLETEITKIFNELDSAMSIVKHDDKVRHKIILEEET